MIDFQKDGGRISLNRSFFASWKKQPGIFVKKAILQNWQNRNSNMQTDPKDDYPTNTEKENMDGPQEEFISDEPPSSAASGDRIPQPNPEKDPNDWTTGNEPMTGPQNSYLKTLSQEAGVEFDQTLTKAEASKRIEDLQGITGRGKPATH